MSLSPVHRIFRFAPSPNGRLHLGHAYSAFLNHDMARSVGGQFLLRLEDIDLARCTPELEAGLLSDLAWLGLTSDAPPRRQSDHFADYDAAISALREAGLTATIDTGTPDGIVYGQTPLPGRMVARGSEVEIDALG